MYLKYIFDVNFPRFQEFELLYRATKEFKLYCLDEYLVDYYIGNDSISNNNKKLYITYSLLLDKHPELTTNYLLMAEKNLAVYCWWKLG